MFGWKTRIKHGIGDANYGRRRKFRVLKFFGLTIWTKKVEEVVDTDQDGVTQNW